MQPKRAPWARLSNFFFQWTRRPDLTLFDDKCFVITFCCLRLLIFVWVFFFCCSDSKKNGVMDQRQSEGCGFSPSSLPHAECDRCRRRQRPALTGAVQALFPRFLPHRNARSRRQPGL